MWYNKGKQTPTNTNKHQQTPTNENYRELSNRRFSNNNELISETPFASASSVGTAGFQTAGKDQHGEKGHDRHGGNAATVHNNHTVRRIRRV